MIERVRAWRLRRRAAQSVIETAALDRLFGQLRRQASEHKIPLKATLDCLKSVQKQMPADRFLPSLQLGAHLASLGFSPERTLIETTDSNLSQISFGQFRYAIGLAASIAERGIDPGRAFRRALNAAKRYANDRVYLAALASIETVYADLGASATKEPSGMCYFLDDLPLEDQIIGPDRTAYWRALDAVASLRAQFNELDAPRGRATLDFAQRLSEQNCQVTAWLNRVLPLAAESTLDQYLYSLDRAFEESLASSPGSNLFPNGLLVALRAGGGAPRLFQQNLEAVEPWLQHQDPTSVSALAEAARSLTGDQLQVVLQTLGQSIGASTETGRSSLQAEIFRSLPRLATHLNLGDLEEVLKFALNNNPARLRIILDHAVVAARHAAGSGTSFPHNLARVLAMIESFLGNGNAESEEISTTWPSSAEQDAGSAGSAWLRTVLTLSSNAQSLDELSTILRLSATLAQRLLRARVASTSTSFSSLYRQLSALLPFYDDFAVTTHQAVTHEEYDQYSSSTVVDHPAWIEILPSGNRLAATAEELVPCERLAPLLDARSWLWSAHRGEVERTVALSRISDLRVYLPGALELFARHGLISPGPLISVYLVGSYPWAAKPGDVDLFVVQPGDAPWSYHTVHQLRTRGVEFFLGSIPCSIQVVGSKTIMSAANREDGTASSHLRMRCVLLRGSALMAGRDLFAGFTPTIEEHNQLVAELQQDCDRANWPELEADPHRIEAKRKWRRLEIRALKSFAKNHYNSR